MSEELSDVYVRPGLPRSCHAELGACMLSACDGLQSVIVAERVPTRTGYYLNSASGEYCPTYQTATSDGRVYPKNEGTH